MALLLFFCRQGMLFKHHPHKASERELELSHKRSRSQNGMTPRSLKWLIVTSGHDKCSGWRLLCLRGISTIGRRGRHGFDWESAGIPVWGFTRALHAKRNLKPRGALASYFWPTQRLSSRRKAVEKELRIPRLPM